MAQAPTTSRATSHAWPVQAAPLIARSPTSPRVQHAAGVAHPHGLLGNSFFLAFCTDLLGFSKLFPGIRLTIGALRPLT